MGPPHHPFCRGPQPQVCAASSHPAALPATRGFLARGTGGLVPGDQKARETRSPPGGLKPLPHPLHQPHTFREQCCLWLGLWLPVTLLGTGEGSQARSLPEPPGIWLLWTRTRLREPRRLLASAHCSKYWVLRMGLLSTGLQVLGSKYQPLSIVPSTRFLSTGLLSIRLPSTSLCVLL